MKQLIYYPGFEIKSQRWLKFALLYIDELHPIIPTSGEQNLTEAHQWLMGETDLIKPHPPTYEEGSIATMDALNIVEKILEHPTRYEWALRHKNIKDYWGLRRNQRCELYSGKFTYDWEEFCIKHGFAKRSPNGIYVSAQLAYIYMTILSQVIADQRGTSPITDYRSLSNLSILVGQPNNDEDKKINLVRSIIKLKVPANLASIPIEKIVKVRNQPGFKAELNAFHAEFDKFYNDLDKAKTPENFVKALGTTWGDFSDEVAKISTKVAIVSVGVWSVCQIAPETIAPYLVAGGGYVPVTIEGTIGIRKTWEASKTKWQCRRYLANLSSLPTYPGRDVRLSTDERVVLDPFCGSGGFGKIYP